MLWEGDWELIEGIPVSMAPAPMRRFLDDLGDRWLRIN
jgi:hypothetical protein